MASIPTNTARTAPLDTSVKLGAAQQRALKDLVAMGFGKQACKEALLRTGTTSMDRLLAALTGPEEPPVRKRDAAGTPKAVPRPRPRPTPQRRAPPTAAPKVGAHLKHGDVRGVASKVYTKGNAHTWIDLKTTSGDVIEVRSTQVESIELSADEVLACSKEMAPDDWLRLRVDGLVKLPSKNSGIVGNRFTSVNGEEKRQLIVEGSTITCALCEETTWDLSGDVHRNWHAAQHSIKSHCGHFASCRRGNAHVELLEKVSGKEISMEGAPVKTSSGPFAASVFLRPVAAPIDGVDGVASPSPRTRRRRRGHESLATPQAVPEGRRSARASCPRPDE